MECGPLPAISNGIIEYFPDTMPTFELGTAAIYECDEGFYLSVDDRVRTCADSDGLGAFTGETPTCIRKSIFLNKFPKEVLKKRSKLVYHISCETMVIIVCVYPSTPPLAADRTFCFRGVEGLPCGGTFLPPDGDTSGATCCRGVGSGGLGGGGYSVVGVQRCIVCDRSEPYYWRSKVIEAIILTFNL